MNGWGCGCLVWLISWYIVSQIVILIRDFKLAFNPSDVWNQPNNTSIYISIGFVSFCMFFIISNHYKNNGILFQTIFDDLKLDVNTRDKKMKICDTIKQMFEYWLKIGLIQAYRFEKQGRQFYKISFSVAPTSTFGEVKYIE